MGTPEFAVPSLKLLAERYQVVQVVTQPDRPAGRKMLLTAPPVKQCAQALGLPVYQPDRIREASVCRDLTQLEPDAIAVVGYGQMIPRGIRELAPLGCVNVHSSLLPKYRGAAPVNWAIAHGEKRTGVTTMRIARQMDAGDILLVRETEIGQDETALELNRRLAPMGAELLLETMDGLSRGEVEPVSQDHAAATKAPMLRREDGLIDWASPAGEIYNRLRGFDPWPGIFTFFRGSRLRVWAASPSEGPVGAPGVVHVEGEEVSVACGAGALVLREVQMEGRKRVKAMDFARGFQPSPEEVLGNG